jgi:hypothetical protein
MDNQLNQVLNNNRDALFYVSYIFPDYRLYGSDTTALVVGQLDKVFILNGDFRKEYQELIPQGFEKCYEFFKANLQHRNEYSETFHPPVKDLIALMEDYKRNLIRLRHASPNCIY